MELAALYRDIVEKSPDAMWVYDHDGRTIYGNPALRRLFGVGEDEMLQLTVFDSLDDLGKIHFAGHLADLRAGRINQADVETQFIRRDGSAVWVIISESELRGPDGEFIGILNRLSDYSDRRATLDNLTTARRRLDEHRELLATRPPRSIVVTGGGSQLEGIEERVQEVFRLPARCARPVPWSGTRQDEPCCATAAGAVALVLGDDGGLGWRDQIEVSVLSHRLARLGQWFRENF